MRAMARGAAILCADNQLGVDVILPHTIKGRTLKPDNVGGALLQLKNVALLTKLRKSIVTKMDARKIGVFEKGKGEIDFSLLMVISKALPQNHLPLSISSSVSAPRRRVFLARTCGKNGPPPASTQLSPKLSPYDSRYSQRVCLLKLSAPSSRATSRVGLNWFLEVVSKMYSEPRRITTRYSA